MIVSQQWMRTEGPSQKHNSQFYNDTSSDIFIVSYTHSLVSFKIWFEEKRLFSPLRIVLSFCILQCRVGRHCLLDREVMGAALLPALNLDVLQVLLLGQPACMAACNWDLREHCVKYLTIVQGGWWLVSQQTFCDIVMGKPNIHQQNLHHIFLDWIWPPHFSDFSEK